MKFFYCIFLQLFLLTSICFSQTTDLKFEKKYYECEDKWIVFPKGEADSTYTYGFIYLDEAAGFTFNLENDFKIGESGKFVTSNKDTTYSIKIRLEPNTKLVAILSDDRLSELELPKEPDWLHFYKSNQDTLASLVRRGYHYNHVGASDLALQYLEKAYQIDNQAEGLDFELAYAYNATSQFEKTIPVLENAIENDPNNYFFYRELGFANLGLNKIKQAEEIYLKGIEMSDDEYQKSEMAINMTQAYFNLNDKTNFDKWAKLTKKYADKNSKMLEYINYWEQKIK